VDITYTEGPDKGKTFKGIYELDGDKAKFCRAGSPDDDRPTEFKTKADSNGFDSVYKRASSERRPAALIYRVQPRENVHPRSSFIASLASQPT
jgi:hypothetical protein